jgi:hypothetical protein
MRFCGPQRRTPAERVHVSPAFLSLDDLQPAEVRRVRKNCPRTIPMNIGANTTQSTGFSRLR